MLVVLPAPLGPIYPNTSPGIHFKRNVVDRVRLIEHAMQSTKLDLWRSRANHALVLFSVEINSHSIEEICHCKFVICHLSLAISDMTNFK